MLYQFALYPLLLAFAVAVYWWAIPARQRKHALLVLSFGILAIVSLRALMSFAFVAALVYLAAEMLRTTPAEARGRRTALLAFGIGVPVAHLALFKYLPVYSDFAERVLENAGWLALPFGISYYTFKLVHYVIETRRGTLPPHTLVDFFCYASFFGSFPAGPIERFAPFRAQTEAPAFDAQLLSEGLARIVQGMVKKILLCDFLLEICGRTFGDVPREYALRPTWFLFGFLWVNFLYLYFDFSGYSDIAVGTSRLFGIRLMENFDWPVLRGNLGEFWRGWHISLTSWCRDYVYFPVFGLTRRPRLAVLASMLVVGYWHGPEPRWLVWGAWHGVGLALWNAWAVRKRRWPSFMAWSQRSRLYRLLSWALTLNYVVLGGIWISSGSVHKALELLAQLANRLL